MIFLILLSHLFLLTNTTFTLWPEMVVYPYLINHNFLLYLDIINPYPPLFTYFLAVFGKIFGYYPLPYQVLTWLVIIAIDISIFYIASKFVKKSQALASVAFFAIFSIPFGINGLWFDLIQTPFILFSIYFFLRGRLVYSAIFLTISFFIKQNVLILAIWLAIFAIFKNRHRLKLAPKIFYLVLPILIILSISTFFFWQKGTVKDFLYWVFYFPYFQASTMTGYILLPTIKQIAIVFALFLFFLPSLVHAKNYYRLIIATAIITLTFAYPRFDYFHLITSLALLSIAVPGTNFSAILSTFTSLSVNSAKDLKVSLPRAKSRGSRLAPPSARQAQTIIIFISLTILILFWAKYLSKNWTAEIRFFEKNIFSAAAALKEYSQPHDLVYIQNGPDQLLPLSNRLPPKPWADEFPWYMEKNNLQEKIISSLKSRDTRFVVFKPYETKGKYETGSYRPQKLADYLDQNYQNFAKIDDTLWLKAKK